MSVFKLSGGDATAIVGGTAIFILLLLSMFAHKNAGLEKTTSYLIEGFQLKAYICFLLNRHMIYSN
ncbi:hypothetical protein UACE39S_03497 [Ureibacillus acetophenoni]